MLWRDGRTVSMQSWAQELLDSMTGICEVLDRGDVSRPYSQALAVQAAKLANVALTPSARLMEELTTTDESFFDLALRMSKAHKDYFLDLYPPNGERLAEFSAQAQESLAKQASIEASDKGTYEEYLHRYFAN
jgi:glutamate--cysteine ligase